MKFDYTVKHNGVYYMAGEDVPMECPQPAKEVKSEEPIVEEKPKATTKKKKAE